MRCEAVGLAEETKRERTTKSPRAAGSTPERSTTPFSTAVSSTSGAVSLNAPRFALQMGVRTCRRWGWLLVGVNAPSETCHNVV